jgi:hypothetical protein
MGAAKPDRQAIREQLEETRRSFHELLSSISADDWERRSGNPEMTVKELMWHTAWATSWMVRSVDGVRDSKSIRVPSFLIEPGRRLAMRWLARKATPDTTARKYDQGHDLLLAKLDSIDDSDWSSSAVRFGEVRTVGWYFMHPPEHFEEHARDVRAVLGANARAD